MIFLLEMKLKFSVHNTPNVPSVLKVPAFFQMIQAGHIMSITLDYHGDIHRIPNVPIVPHVTRVPSVLFYSMLCSLRITHNIYNVPYVLEVQYALNDVL